MDLDLKLCPRGATTGATGRFDASDHRPKDLIMQAATELPQCSVTGTGGKLDPGQGTDHNKQPVPH